MCVCLQPIGKLSSASHSLVQDFFSVKHRQPISGVVRGQGVLRMPSPGPHLKPPESESQEVRPWNLHIYKLTKQF